MRTTKHMGENNPETQVVTKRGNTPQATRVIRYQHLPIGDLPSVEKKQLSPSIGIHKKNRRGLRYDDRSLLYQLKRGKRL